MNVHLKMNRTPDIEAEISFLRTEDGGRHSPAFSGYRPHHKIREDYQTSGVHEYIDRDHIAPGDQALGRITFISPEAYPGCLWIGREILIQEGNRTVGRARVTKIMNRLLEKRDEPTAEGDAAKRRV